MDLRGFWREETENAPKKKKMKKRRKKGRSLQIPRGPYMPHERATVKRMASQGQPARAIAATLGRPLRGLRDFMRRQKIRRAAQ